MPQGQGGEGDPPVAEANGLWGICGSVETSFSSPSKLNNSSLFSVLSCELLFLGKPQGRDSLCTQGDTGRGGYRSKECSRKQPVM